MSSFLNAESRERNEILNDQPADSPEAKFDLLLRRNKYLEKEYARVIKELMDEKELSSARLKELQLLNELKSKCSSLEEKYTRTIERMNEYHQQMQQAKGETIGLKRKIKGILVHTKTTLLQESVPGKTPVVSSGAYEAIKEENKLLKWKLQTTQAYLSGMFPEEEQTIDVQDPA